MPITFVPNPNGPRLGPGIQIAWSSDFIGPLPSGSIWRVSLRGTSGESPWIVWEKPTQAPVGGHWTPFVFDQGSSLSTRVDLTIGAQTAAHADVELVTPTAVVDSGSLQAQWDVQSGLPVQLQSLTGGTSGGFTQTDREQLGEIQLATVAALPTNIPISGIAQTGLSALVEGPPDQLLRRGETILLTGDGSVDRPSGSGSISAYGAIWDFQVVPPGFGFDRGPVLEYGRRMAQLAVIRADAAGNEFTHDLVDIHSSFGKLRFPWQCRRIEYSIAPGVTLALTWLLFVVQG